MAQNLQVFSQYVFLLVIYAVICHWFHLHFLSTLDDDFVINVVIFRVRRFILFHPSGFMLTEISISRLQLV